MVEHNRQQQIVLWILWFAMVDAIVIYQFLLGHGVPRGSDAPGGGVNPVVVLAGVQLLAAAAIRWLLLPRAGTTGKVLVLMIVGLALSESVEFYGLFLVPADLPSTKLGLWLLALVSALQFAPVYARAARLPANPFRPE
jgi:F0F1-type ATP synthase membrane subunit c/vacuolar-type H+-ATPase subunit K